MSSSWRKAEEIALVKKASKKIHQSLGERGRDSWKLKEQQVLVSNVTGSDDVQRGPRRGHWIWSSLMTFRTSFRGFRVGGT